eukprot:7487247-Pyramimonas_sp.AAC.1
MASGNNIEYGEINIRTLTSVQIFGIGLTGRFFGPTSPPARRSYSLASPLRSQESSTSHFEKPIKMGKKTSAETGGRR